MQYIFGIHAVDGLLRSHPKSVHSLRVQQGREDKRIVALLELAKNQGVPVARVQRTDLDALGVLAVVDKPVDVDDLLKLVQTAVED